MENDAVFASLPEALREAGCGPSALSAALRLWLDRKLPLTAEASNEMIVAALRYDMIPDQRLRAGTYPLIEATKLLPRIDDDLLE